MTQKVIKIECCSDCPYLDNWNECQELVEKIHDPSFSVHSECPLQESKESEYLDRAQKSEELIYNFVTGITDDHPLIKAVKNAVFGV